MESEDSAVAALVWTIDKLGPASVHACTYGRPLTVVAPTETIARLARAALALTAKRRPTDNLITIRPRE